MNINRLGRLVLVALLSASMMTVGCTNGSVKARTKKKPTKQEQAVDNNQQIQENVDTAKDVLGTSGADSGDDKVTALSALPILNSGDRVPELVTVFIEYVTGKRVVEDVLEILVSGDEAITKDKKEKGVFIKDKEAVQAAKFQIQESISQLKEAGLYGEGEAQRVQELASRVSEIAKKDRSDAARTRILADYIAVPIAFGLVSAIIPATSFKKLSGRISKYWNKNKMGRLFVNEAQEREIIAANKAKWERMHPAVEAPAPLPARTMHELADEAKAAFKELQGGKSPSLFKELLSRATKLDRGKVLDVQVKALKNRKEALELVGKSNAEFAPTHIKNVKQIASQDGKVLVYEIDLGARKMHVAFSQKPGTGTVDTLLRGNEDTLELSTLIFRQNSLRKTQARAGQHMHDANITNDVSLLERAQDALRFSNDGLAALKSEISEYAIRSAIARKPGKQKMADRLVNQIKDSEAKLAALKTDKKAKAETVAAAEKALTAKKAQLSTIEREIMDVTTLEAELGSLRNIQKAMNAEGKTDALVASRARHEKSAKKAIEAVVRTESLQAENATAHLVRASMEDISNRSVNFGQMSLAMVIPGEPMPILTGLTGNQVYGKLFSTFEERLIPGVIFGLGVGITLDATIDDSFINYEIQDIEQFIKDIDAELEVASAS